MLNELDYRSVLEELGFDLLETPKPGTGKVGRSLRHTTMRFPGIRGRPPKSSPFAFWPTLYWNRSGDSIYFSTTRRDQDYFPPSFWKRAPSDRVLPHEQKAVTDCFLPLEATREGLRKALESLFLARPGGGLDYGRTH